MSSYLQSFKAATLYEKTSAKGNRYYVGRMGGVRVTLLKSGDKAEDGSAIWHLMFAEAPPRDGQPQTKPKRVAPAERATKEMDAARDWQRPLDHDGDVTVEIPF